jgi:hypothetical protein
MTPSDRMSFNLQADCTIDHKPQYVLTSCFRLYFLHHIFLPVLLSLLLTYYIAMFLAFLSAYPTLFLCLRRFLFRSLMLPLLPFFFLSFSFLSFYLRLFVSEEHLAGPFTSLCRFLRYNGTGIPTVGICF